MMKHQSTTYRACRAYRNQAPHLLELPSGDSARVEWIRHSAACEDCRSLIKSHTIVIAHLLRMQDQEPAHVRGRVMAVVHGSRHPAGFFRPREVAWGLATGFAGAALGLMLSMIGPTLETVVTTDSQQNYSTAVSDDFDQLAVELASSK